MCYYYQMSEQKHCVYCKEPIDDGHYNRFLFDISVSCPHCGKSQDEKQDKVGEKLFI